MGGTRGDALAAARRSIPAAEATLLMQHVLGVSRAALGAHPEAALDDDQSAAFADLVARRADGWPIAYLTGEREFYGRSFHVTPAVLIPRPETELLVELGTEKLRGRARPRILELGTGSGCIAVSLACELPGAAVTAVDLSESSLEVARGNAARHGVLVDFLRSDWFSAVTGGFDLIVANPPYVADGDSHLGEGDLRFEPPTALACGPDGLDAIRRIVLDAPRHLLPVGWLFLEHGYDQGPALAELLAAAGFDAIEQRRDLAGIVRASGGRISSGG